MFWSCLGLATPVYEKLGDRLVGDLQWFPGRFQPSLRNLRTPVVLTHVEAGVAYRDVTCFLAKRMPFESFADHLKDPVANRVQSRNSCW